MWPWSKRKESTSNYSFRETLFGDMPLSTWAGAGNGEPWASFANAVASLERGDRTGGIDALRAIVLQPGLESRHYLQAWCALRELGVLPAADLAKHVYGVVVDVPVSDGLDSLAAYEDRRARYVNFSGAVIVWEAPDSRMDDYLEELLAAGRKLAKLIGPWEGTRPALPPGQARISLLTPSGLHFGQAPLAAFTQDAMAAPLLDAATRLMQSLIRLTEASRGTA
jgi:hypothetical protein